MTNKTGDDEGEEEAEGEEIYQDAIGEEGRTKESSGINENEDTQKEREKNDDLGKPKIFKSYGTYGDRCEFDKRGQRDYKGENYSKGLLKKI